MIRRRVTRLYATWLLFKAIRAQDAHIHSLVVHWHGVKPQWYRVCDDHSMPWEPTDRVFVLPWLRFRAVRHTPNRAQELAMQIIREQHR